ncbi:MBL fold metallo-hydrolase [Salipaludibacillus aurantiacus]|uniref:Ribonuclease BN, tRNA processing enzyme n=1 Tax=Salipaludibacillus aurantiacus TaxID=1601833 RepID=A0A1H9T7C3_9BACI|nr:MBL fold metallo-hydrolase [Salipaludibacillus aurantiacus]SER92864.1 Ribonuclease BN, tRNA processing enzyme [Salipaludibacillus aurantiacus]
MKITVIGYWGAYPEANEATSCFLLEEGNTNILLDCGSGAVSKLQNYKALKDINAVILSHYHHDHAADLGVLTYSRVVDINLNKTDQPLNIFAHEKDKKEYSKLGKPPYTNVQPYNGGSKVEVGPFTLQFQQTAHSAPCYAMKIRSEKSPGTLVYTADTSYDENLSPFCRDADLLIAETSFYAGQDAASFGHMTSSEVARLASNSGCKSVLLSHLPHFGNHHQLLEETEAEFKGDIQIAKTGAIFNL